MDLGTTIIGVISITICALPFILTSRNKKKKEKELLNSLINFARQNGSEITKHEIGTYFAIGLDESKNTISFLQKTKKSSQFQFIDLSLIKKCQINNISKSLSNNETVVDKLNLNLTTLSIKDADFNLQFYNSNISFQLSSEFDSLEKWNKIINNILNNKLLNMTA
ncbi:hypothetical protein [Polaribacter sp. Asnod1-A03]|uniref:hypothetical protein n=1 Tax=Polaribacter sp. Asnod1-A03 TaxID=3160581 RepID=UPI003862DCB9